ncbi:MAG: FAD-dependent oxidoreductase, partial [Chloroflexota bacterium]
MAPSAPAAPHRVTVVGGGFGGLYAARRLGKDERVDLTVVDRRNHHLFQPLLYQVATGALAPGEIAQPLRSILRKHANTTVLLGEAVGLDLERREVRMSDGGPTGVELAGALGEIARDTLRRDFRAISSRDAEIILVEAMDRVLQGYPPGRSASAARQLKHLGVDVRTNTRVTDINEHEVTVETAGGTQVIPARTVLWGAGVQASAFAKEVAAATGAETDKAGRIKVGPDLTIPGHPEIFVIGDAAVQPWKPE